MVDKKRRIIKLLPEINQTDTLKKFFSATVDHLMQPEDVEFLTGYIGSKPAYYNPATDYYVSEPTVERSNYQLPVTAISVNTQSGITNNIMFYDDIVNQLAFDGAIVDNPSRLFDQEYYSWAPPIDMDKLINYTRYLWLPSGPSPILLLNQTDALHDIVGQPNYTYTGAYQLSSTGQVVVGSFKFTTGLAIIFSNDVDVSIQTTNYIIDVDSNGITLNQEPNLLNPAWDVYAWDTEGWDGDANAFTKMYTTIARWSADQNQWSAANSWYHSDVITLSQTPLADFSTAGAQRPIIEFTEDILIWDYGFYGRPPVDLVVYNIPDVFATIVGKPGFVIDTITLVDGMRLLVISDVTDSNVNNKIYTVQGITDRHAIDLVLATDGQNADGSPAFGDRVYTRFGYYEKTNFWYNANNVWRYQGQQYSLTSPPLFELFDTSGTSLSNPTAYPNNNFAGNTLFSYINNPATSPYDSILGIYAQRDSFGALQFDNGLSTASVNYVVNGTTQTYVGYVFYQTISNTLQRSFGNDWHKAASVSRQYLINDYFDIQIGSSVVPTILNIDQLPATYVVGQLPTIRVYLTRNGTQTLLLNGIDYNVTVDSTNNQPQITVTAGVLLTGDRVTIETWNTAAPANVTGYFGLPPNLTANSNNKEVTVISQSQLLDQFIQIIQNQYNFVGSGLGVNNYRDTYKDLSLGETILQHRAPMLKTMILNSGNVSTGPTSTVSSTDPILAIQFAQREYTRFYNKFVKMLQTLSANGYTLNNPTSDWISTALKQINVGKTPASPWANSGYSSVQGGYTFQQSATPNYIPATATRLGVAAAYEPTVYMQGENMIIQTHDGARIIMQDADGNPLGTILNGYKTTSTPDLLTNPIARAWLQFELNLFNDMPPAYNDPDAALVFDVRTVIPGKWRNSDYTWSEYQAILRPMFDKWSITNQVDYAANTTFDLNDQFSWNYNGQYDAYGNLVPGNWRGIYRWYYDTDRPHTHPWEMLGFGQMPPWWTSEYGAAPYTSGNTYMWTDLRDGVIRQGPRAGTYQEWARPGLLTCIPVDPQGNLLPPNAAGTVISLPAVYQARAEWVFGDGSPVESVWVHSQDYNFVIAQLGYLMKPARFMEYCWDTLRTEQIFAGTEGEQWIYVDTNSRRNSGQFYVQRENPVAIGQGISIPNESTLSYYQSGGIQHWISEFLVSQSIGVTTYFGNIVRGCQANLAHKVGAYINSNADLRVTADSFGVVGYKSNLVPSENINVYLYRSTSTGSSFYGGVIVKQVSAGWQVYGYDGILQQFSIIPSSQTGGKQTFMLGNVQVTKYARGLTNHGEPVVTTVPYGTIYTTVQQVYDFLISLGRYQANQGWVFDTYNPNANSMSDWTQSASDFVYWSQAQWADGNFISLSPLANSVKYQQEFGNIDFVNGIVGGTYPVVDRSGFPIGTYNLEILRYDGEITVNPTSTQSIYGLRLFTTTLEHVMVFDNETSFGDTIYDDLYNLAQPRLKLYAYRTNNWTGRLDAPGYFLYQNTVDNTWSMKSNFEKTANDFTKYFNINQPKNYDIIDPITSNVTTVTSTNSVIDQGDIADLAKHLYGYQQRTYLEDLIFEDSTEFQFYQGVIRQKGTVSAIDAIVRNTSIIPLPESFNYYEEFALRIGRYGSVALNTNVDFILEQTQFDNDPQQITIFGDLNSNRETNGIIEFIENDPRFVVPPMSWTNNRFPLRKHYGPNYDTDLPTAGYVELGEPEWLVTNLAGLTSLYYTNYTNQVNNISNIQLQDRDMVWQFIDTATGWTIWQFTLDPASIDHTIMSSVGAPGSPTVIVCDQPHLLNNGDLVVLTGISNSSILNNQTYTISNVDVTGTMFTVPASTFQTGIGGSIYSYRKVRFGNVALRDSNPPVGGWKNGDHAYVDLGDIGINGWTVYQLFEGNWVSIRAETYKVDSSLMLGSKIYSQTDRNILVVLSYFDPAKGIIPGIADVGLDYKTSSDPAKYNKGDATIYPLNINSAWESEHIGQTWWDLSTVRYIDYEIGSDSYRWKNWGKIAPGTTVDVYEWVRSPVSPTNWASYINTGKGFSQFGLDYAPSGTVRNASNPAWTQTVEYDSQGTAATWYYFWVTNATTLPLPSDRGLTTLQISNTIANPSVYGVSWYAAIDQNNIVVSNIGTYLNEADSVMQILYTQKPNNGNDHKQWTLVRSGDASSTIDNYFWNKMHDSLVGFDGMGNTVPDLNLSVAQRYGTLIRPRQSWFVNQEMAGKIYVDTVNALLSNIAIVESQTVSNWEYFFNLQEPIPTEPGSYDFVVNTIGERNNITAKDGQTVLVMPNIDTGYLWVIYQWDYSSQIWLPIRVQEYNTTAYWDYVDYYDASAGVSSSTIPTVTIDTEEELGTLSVAVGSIVKVANNGANLWEWWQWDGVKWTQVALQSGTIQLLSSLYDGTGPNINDFNQGGFDSGTGFDINPSTEFSNIINGVRYAIFGSANSSNTIELNQIFFAMINYVLSEQGFVDWIVKTSYIVLEGFNNPIYTGELYQADNIPDLLDYINEIKPYRTKVRQFISSRSMSDNVTVQVTDFDLPVTNGLTLDVSDQFDANIIANTSSLQAWYNNYQSNPSLIRTIKTKILFDRVASVSLGWDTYGFSNQGWQYEGGNTPSYGAWDRIQQYYNPTVGMIPKDSDQLISGTAYKGVIISGLGFDVQLGWQMSPWDSQIGWSGDENNFNNYLDLIISGGVNPIYDSFYGDGVTLAFQLSKVPLDVPNTAVWSDGILRVYGQDWIIPNWVTLPNVILGGSNYMVGEILVLDFAPSVAPAKVLVTAVDINGGITALSMVANGNYDIVPGGPVGLVYPPNRLGMGAGATIQPIWGGQTLVFKNAPSASTIHNIFVLFSGETFEPAPTGAYDMIFDGYNFVQPDVAEDHAEELYTTNLTSSMRIDVYTEQASGHPIVYTRTYIADGLKDTFDLGIRPQDQSSVLVSLDGIMLTFGIGNDYVINFSTNKVVFIHPPASGTLQIVTIGSGGSGLDMAEPYVVYSGTDYEIGDYVTLSGGVGTFANVQVTSVQVSDSYYHQGWDIVAWDTSPWSYTGGIPAAIFNGGNNYVVGDQLILVNDGNTVVTTRAMLTVTSADIFTGTIETLALTEPGNYTVPPATQIFETTGKGSGANIAIAWGASTLSLENKGFYFVRPTEPVSQLSTTGGGFNLTVDASYTTTEGTGIFKGDGVTTTFNVTFAITTVDNMMVTVDGIVLPKNQLSLTGLSTVVLANPPALNSTVIITGFNTGFYSVVNDQTFVVQAGIQYYQLNIIPGSSMPPYNSILVLKNGVALKPPPMNNFIGDGVTTVYSMDFSPNPADLTVYVDNALLMPTIDYSVSTYFITFVSAPPANSKIAMVYADLTVGFDFNITGVDIFLPTAETGDKIRVITFTEDYSYGWVADSFGHHGWEIALWDGKTWSYDGSAAAHYLGNGAYQLSQVTNEPDSMMVFVEGELQSMMWDYTFENTDTVIASVANVSSMSGNIHITTLSNVASLSVGMVVESVAIPADTYIQGIQIGHTSIITLSQPALDTDITTLTAHATTSVIRFNPEYAPNIDANVVVVYTTFLANEVPIAWRTLIGDDGTTNSIAIDNNRKTSILNNVYVYSNEIEIANITAIGAAPGAIWIDNELITYQTMLPAPTINYPNRGIISELGRGAGVTSNLPLSVYDTLYYYGDGVNKYFPAGSATYPIAETVYVDGVVQTNSAFDAANGTYVSTTLNIPVELPPGRYIVFNDDNIPPPGWRNVRIVALNVDFNNSSAIHLNGADVIDASKNVAIPGGYQWEPAINGLQHSTSKQARFLLAHSGTRS